MSQAGSGHRATPLDDSALDTGDPLARVETVVVNTRRGVILRRRS